MASFILTANDVRRKGLDIMNVNSKTDQETQFRKHFGSSSHALSAMWFDLLMLPVNGAVLLSGNEEKGDWGFKRFMLANFWLWTYPRNACLTSSRFQMCEKHCRGHHLWDWIKKIQSLMSHKVSWSPSVSAIFIVTVDGTDFRIWEPSHPMFNQDKRYYSQKHNHGSIKYEIAICLYTGKVLHINGPFPGGENDLNMFRDKLKAKIPEGKLVIADSGYKSSQDDEQMFSLPNAMDSTATAAFKSRARCCQESFNGRIKNFACLRDTFRHGIEKHQIAFEAVVAILHYQIDSGSPLFEV